MPRSLMSAQRELDANLIIKLLLGLETHTSMLLNDRLTSLHIGTPPVKGCASPKTSPCKAPISTHPASTLPNYVTYEPKTAPYVMAWIT
jgi:hypothetical protein